MSALAPVVGPFFMGVALECMAMGAVLILSIHYFVGVNERKQTPNDSSKTTGGFLVSTVLLADVAKTAVDLVSGWRIFAVGFGDLAGFLHPSPYFFASPFIGLLPAVTTQIFLLSRVIRFISSMDVFWPRLARRSFRYPFAAVVLNAILLSAIEGAISAYRVWQSGNLVMLSVDGENDSRFRLSSSIWLISSSAIDALLSLALCAELWWARRKLSFSGSRMRAVVTGLFFVTFHGGLAVTTVQIVSLILYRTQPLNAYCYMPMLVLPEIYSITLILSLSIPSDRGVAANPSQAMSLPTIIESMERYSGAARRNSSPVLVYRGTSPPCAAAEQSPKDVMGKRENRSSIIKKTWRYVRRDRDHTLQRVEDEKSASLGVRRESHHHRSDGIPVLSTPPCSDRRPSAQDSLAFLLDRNRSYSYPSSLPSARLSLPELPELPMETHPSARRIASSIYPSARYKKTDPILIFANMEPFAPVLNSKRGHELNIPSSSSAIELPSSSGYVKPLPLPPSAGVVIIQSVTSSLPTGLITENVHRGPPESPKGTKRHGGRLLSFQDMLSGPDDL